MGRIKQAGVCAGIAVGSVIGGTVSMIGKMTDKRVIDELGENIMDSTILTGEIVGEAASGATNLVAGKIKKQPSKVKKGKKELGSAGGRVVENAVTNVKNVADQSGEILEGIKMKDKKRVAKGLRTLGKMAVVGMLTVGAIKVDEIAEEPSGHPQKDKEEAAFEAAAAGRIAKKAAETGAEANYKTGEKASYKMGGKAGWNTDECDGDGAAAINDSGVEQRAAERIETFVEQSLEEPSAEISSEPISKPDSKPIPEPVTEPGSKPIPEPVTEPGSKPIPEPVTEPGSVPIPEHVTEPGSVPVLEPVTEPGSLPEAKSVSGLPECGDKPETATIPEQAVSGGAEKRPAEPKRRSGLEAILKVKAESDEEADLSMEPLLKKQPSLEEELEKKIRF